jgi:TRAP-type C4-dicarboxylate transport system, small permease component
MKRVLTWLDCHFEEALCGFLLVAVMTMLMAQVIVRAVFGYGLTASEELSRFSFLYLVYFAASLVAGKGVHIRVTAQMKFYPKILQTISLLMADLFWLVFNSVVIYQGTLFVLSMARKPMVSGALLIDMRLVFVAVPVAFTLQSLRILQRWLHHFRSGTPLLGEQVSLETEA